MKENQLKFKFFLTASSVLAVILAFYLFIDLPLLNNVNKFKRNLFNTRELLAILKMKESQFSELKSLDEEVEKNFSLVAGTVLAEKDLLDFVVLLENLARSHKVILTIDQLPSPTFSSVQNFGVLSLRLNLWGAFPNLYRFLQSLENMNLWLNVDAIKMVKLTSLTLPVGPQFTGLTFNDLSAMVDLSVFFSKEEL